MKRTVAAVLAMGLAADILLGGCTPYPGYGYPPPPTPLVSDQGLLLDECTVIRREIARQQRIADYSGVMATPLTEASVRLNVYNVIIGLQQRAAIAGCPA
jgi:hypothetical protein